MEGQFDDADESVENISNLKINSNDDYHSDESYEDDSDNEIIFDMNNDRSNRGYNKQNESKNVMNYQPNLKLFRKFENRINVDMYDPDEKLPLSTMNLLNETSRKMEEDRRRIKDKCDRATVEQVLDPRTRMILFKLINRGIVDEINGCISTGKEANVYHAVCSDGIDKAVKIYKTSILTFKDRDKYVRGEFRYRSGYCRHNPRKMVRTWAEKEMRNLSRIYQAGLSCPQPFVLRSHVLVMSFIGTSGFPAPLLKDVQLSQSKARELYLDCVIMMRRLYNECKLVHADLSEFNLLYHEGKLVIIDVSQSVENDHPMAFEFLRKDCVNVNEFFRKNSVPTMTSKQLFDFITDPNINDENIDEYLEKAQEIASQRTIEQITEKEKIEEEVFKNSYIPQRLDQVIDYETDITKVQKGEKKILYGTVSAMKPDLSGPSTKPALLDRSDDESNDDDDECEDSDDENVLDNQNKESKFKDSSRPKNEDLDEKKARKQAIKEEKREKRKTKIPKHIKKRKERLGRNNKK